MFKLISDANLRNLYELAMPKVKKFSFFYILFRLNSYIIDLQLNKFIL